MKPKYTEEEAAKMVADAVEAERDACLLAIQEINKAGPAGRQWELSAWREGVKSAFHAVNKRRDA